MKRRMSGRTGLFLLELIIAIFFFIIAAAVCIQLFVKSHMLGRETEELSEAIKICTNYAEQYSADACGALEKYYDASFGECTLAEAVYVLRVLEVVDEEDVQGTLATASISIRKLQEESPLFAISLTKYRQGGD